MAYNLNETPAGLVNSVNKEYTTTNTLYQAVIITVDGVVYTGDAVFVDNTFTLDDAPTTTITISYYDEAVSPIAVGTLLVSSVSTIWRRQKRETSDVSEATFLDWCNWINLFLYREILKKDPEWFITTAEITDNLAETGEFLPNDFKQLRAFNTGMFEEVNDVVQHDAWLITKAESELSGYYVNNNKVIFTPIERTEVREFQFRYIPIEPKITATTDYFIAPLTEAYIEVLIHDLNKFYEMWDENAGLESLADFRFSRSLDELLKSIRRTPQTYFFDDPSQDF